MWLKYDYVCSDCDSLVEVTTLENLDDWRGWCPCGSPALTWISVSDGNAPIITDVSKVTAPQVVKINTNPYN